MREHASSIGNMLKSTVYISRTSTDMASLLAAISFALSPDQLFWVSVRVTEDVGTVLDIINHVLRWGRL